MRVKISLHMFANVLRRAAETDQRFPWIRQVDFYLDSCIEIDNDWATVDLERAEQKEPTRH